MNTSLMSHPVARLAVLAAVIGAAMALPVRAAQMDAAFGDPVETRGVETRNAAPIVALVNPEVYAIVSGGVGDEERSKMESQVGRYSMRLVLSSRNGQYVVADSISVRKQGAEVMQINDAGPLVYAQMPPGQYSITANYKGVVQTRTVTIGPRATDVHLTWPTELD